jgi:hypothetical protein
MACGANPGYGRKFLDGLLSHTNLVFCFLPRDQGFVAVTPDCGIEFARVFEILNTIPKLGKFGARSHEWSAPFAPVPDHSYRYPNSNAIEAK